MERQRIKEYNHRNFLAPGECTPEGEMPVTLLLTRIIEVATEHADMWGGIIFGIGIGFLTIMIRYFGAYPEGMSFAILIMNSTVPLINRWFHQKRYGRK